jgi:hypothetical protein
MRWRLVVAELAAASVSGLMAVITIVWPAWIKLVFRVDPDHGSGLFELLIVGVLIAVAVASSLAARAERHRDDRSRNWAEAR